LFEIGTLNAEPINPKQIEKIALKAMSKIVGVKAYQLFALKDVTPVSSYETNMFSQPSQN
jgi:hypothetical protein